jgi:hypothetical protein
MRTGSDSIRGEALQVLRGIEESTIVYLHLYPNRKVLVKHKRENRQDLLAGEGIAAIKNP